MHLKKIAIENIRSYEKQEINFPRGSTLLSGDIGSGKTTILLAVEFALFGLQPSQRASSLLRTDKNNAKVTLEFEIDGKNVIIERRLKRGKKSVSQDYASIKIDNEKFEESVTEIKSKVLGLLNYPQEFAKKTNDLYKFTVYTPQEEMKQIILESNDSRLNTLRHVFGIDKYKRIQENTNLLNSKLREKIRINDALSKDLDKIKEQLILKEKNLSESKEKLAKIELAYNQITEERKSKEESIKKIQEKINEKRSLENEKLKSDLLINEKNQQISNLEHNTKELRRQISETEKLKFNQVEYISLDERIKFQENKGEGLQKEYMETLGKINLLESRKLEASVLINKISGLEKCPTCLQEVSQKYKENMLTNANNQINSLDIAILEFNHFKKDLIEKINLAKNMIKNFVKQKSEMDLLGVKLENLKEKENRVSDLEKQKRDLEKDIGILIKKAKDIQISIGTYNKYEKIFEEKNREVHDIKIKENDFAIKKAETNKEIQFLEQQMKENLEEIEKKEQIKKQTEEIKELEFWISQKFIEIVLFTEKQIMITLKDEFSKLFSKWFSMLVSDALSAKLDDNFSPVIEQQDYELDYSFLSGGEKTAIALAYRLSLNQVINSLLSNIKTSDLVILDEPTDGFSYQQLDKMRDVLNQLDIEQLILVSHEQKMEDFVDNIIKIKKENGVSCIE